MNQEIRLHNVSALLEILIEDGAFAKINMICFYHKIHKTQNHHILNFYINILYYYEKIILSLKKVIFKIKLYFAEN